MAMKSPRALLLAICAISVFGDQGDLTPDFGQCHCHKTSGNRMSCCSERDHAGMGTGNFCGSHFVQRHCGGENPVCCTSIGEAQCCPAGSSCSAGCLGGGAGGKGFGGCGCLPPPQPSEALHLYNETRARAFAQFAFGAYCGVNGPGLLTWSCAECEDAGMKVLPGMRLVDRNDKHTNHSLFAYVARLEGEQSACVVAFRGTVNIANWKRNLQSTNLSLEDTFDCQGCGVHKGFASVFTSLQAGDDGVIESLKALGCGPGTDREVFVAGHSMGAAVATLAMYDLHTKGFKIGRSYIFESPRVGNLAFARSFSSLLGSVPLFRITHNRDPVIRLPSSHDGWMHVGAESYYGPSWNNSYVVCQDSEDPLCSKRYWFLDDFFSGQAIQDHCMNPLLEEGQTNYCLYPDFCRIYV